MTMKMRSTVFSLLALLGLLLALALTGCGGEETAEPPSNGEATGSGTVGEGSPAPAFSGTTIDGDQVSLANFGGKPLLLNFWATW